MADRRRYVVYPLDAGYLYEVEEEVTTPQGIVWVTKRVEGQNSTSATVAKVHEDLIAEAKRQKLKITQIPQSNS